MKHYHLSHSDNAFCRVVVTVPFGSGHEPADWPGLAHLLEHCLFLGSHKLQPEPGTNPATQDRELDPLAAGELQGIMAQAGIRINASTRLEQSCYMLECLPEQLEEAFLRLLQLIYAPVFHPQEVIAEVSIIDGEYQAYCEHPEQQLLNLAQQQVHPEHAFHTFSAGNRSTLGHNDPELLRQLLLAYETGYLSQAASLYIEHPNAESFGVQSEQFAQWTTSCRLKAKEQFNPQNPPHNHSAGLTPDTPSNPPSPTSKLFCHHQTLLAGTDQAVIQWFLEVDNHILSQLILKFGSLTSLTKALQQPTGFTLSLAMQWQHQAILRLSHPIPETVDSLKTLLTTAEERLQQFQQAIKKVVLKAPNTESAEQAQTQSPSQPELLRATETAIQWFYRDKIQRNSESLKGDWPGFQQQLTGAAALTLISHPGFSGLSSDFLRTEHFPTAYLPTCQLTGDGLVTGRLDTAPLDVALSNTALTGTNTPAPMPFRAVVQALSETQRHRSDDQEKVRLSASTRLNHAALVWVPCSAWPPDDNGLPRTSDDLSRMLYPHFYQKLRIQLRIGYIVQVMPFSLGTTDQKGCHEGVAILVQSATHTSEALTDLIEQQLEDVPDGQLCPPTL